MTSEAASKADVICIASSLLQKSVFRSSEYASHPHLIIGNRGIKGDLNYEKSVMNNYEFLEDFNSLLCDGPAELFIPNALNSVYFFSVSHPSVKKISFVDEGLLTRRFLQGGYRKPRSAYVEIFPALFALARKLPKRQRIFAYRALAALVQRTVVKFYVSDTANYPRRTIELSRKGGIVLSHILSTENLPWVRKVDLTQNIEVKKDCIGASCLFIHPNQLASESSVDAICQKISGASTLFERGLIKPHPLFSDFPHRLTELKKKLQEIGGSWSEVTLTEQYEPTIELYARGIRVFFVGKSSVTETIQNHPAYFSGLRLIEL